jgi:hypothetical protein
VGRVRISVFAFAFLVVIPVGNLLLRPRRALNRLRHPNLILLTADKLIAVELPFYKPAVYQSAVYQSVVILTRRVRISVVAFAFASEIGPDW